MAECCKSKGLYSYCRTEAQHLAAMKYDVLRDLGHEAAERFHLGLLCLCLDVLCLSSLQVVEAQPSLSDKSSKLQTRLTIRTLGTSSGIRTASGSIGRDEKNENWNYQQFFTLTVLSSVNHQTYAVEDTWTQDPCEDRVMFFCCTSVL